MWVLYWKVSRRRLRSRMSCKTGPKSICKLAGRESGVVMLGLEPRRFDGFSRELMGTIVALHFDGVKRGIVLDKVEERRSWLICVRLHVIEEI